MQEEALPRVNELRRFIRVMLNRAVVVFGVIIIGAVIVCAIFAPIVAPYDPDAQNLDNVLQPPSIKHLLSSLRHQSVPLLG